MSSPNGKRWSGCLKAFLGGLAGLALGGMFAFWTCTRPSRAGGGGIEGGLADMWQKAAIATIAVVLGGIVGAILGAMLGEKSDPEP